MSILFILAALISLHYVEAREATEFQRLESLILKLQEQYETLQTQYRTVITKYGDLQEQYQYDMADRNKMINQMEKRLLILEKLERDRTIEKQHDTSSLEANSSSKPILTGTIGNYSPTNKSVNPYGLEGQKRISLQEHGNAHKNSPRIKQREIPEIPAFYAYLSSSEPHPGQHQTVMFDAIQTNIGNHYNKHSGMFTVPKPGVYFFTWTVAVYCHAYVATELVVNSAARGFIESDISDICDYEDATGNAVLQVNAGDVVYVRTSKIYSIVGAITSVDHIKTTFAGFLIAGQ